MRIYTRTGDEGETGLFGGGRVRKSDPRVEAYGAVDELNAVIGTVIGITGTRAADQLALVQADLFGLGAHLATPHKKRGRRPQLPELPTGRISDFELWIDEMEEALPPLAAFILPGGTPAAATLHFARTVCRRAERRVVALTRIETVDPQVLVYLNRLSDYLFVLARFTNHLAGVADRPWAP